MNDYGINYYDITEESVRNQLGYIRDLSNCVANEKVALELQLAEKASIIEQNLYNKYGVNKFMFRRDLDTYLTNNSNVVLRRVSDYQRFIPPVVINRINAVEAQRGGETFVLSFSDEVELARPNIKNDLLSDNRKINKVKVSLNIEAIPKNVDPICFGAVRGEDGRMWDKLWILGAWYNNYPTLTTSETIIASIFNRGNQINREERLITSGLEFPNIEV